MGGTRRRDMAGSPSPDQIKELRLPEPLEAMGSKSESASAASGRMMGWEEMENKRVTSEGGVKSTMKVLFT
ncbi:hypothetical protein L1887_19485 [Cichorium endivia]|nr:hypothetical protein L1887_19485 [Cichorium endivia]